MKNAIKIGLIFPFVAAIISCGNSNDANETGDTVAANTSSNMVNDFAEIKKAHWLIGEWQNNSAEGNATEAWEMKNDSVLSGKSYFVIGKDTVSSERISLEQHGKDLFYIPTVKGQNNDQPVKFTLTSSTEKEMIFENPAHDFPQKISYTKISSDSLLAEISGTVEGKANSQKFPMKKVK